MVVVLGLWIYIFIISLSIGYFSLRTIYKFLGDNRRVTIAPAYIAGTVVLTVFAQIFSLFSKISLIAHLIVLVVAILLLAINIKDLRIMFGQYRKEIAPLEGLLYLGIALLCAFFTSRGAQHADTGLYHAQVIHWIEEYSAIKGWGNLMTNYSYNSSWLCYTALFSLHFINGTSYHVTNGLIMLFSFIYVVQGLMDWRKHKNHLADSARIAMLFYILVVCVVAMSPSTDQPAMYMVLYIVIRWLENMEEDNSVNVYALLCVLSVYTITLKLSAGLIVLLTISPMISLLKEKNVKAIVTYLLMGLFTVLPFFARNFIISGWLIYPYPAIDLFNVEWKIPVGGVESESKVIMSYARKTYESHLADLSFREWFPVWWERSEHYDRQLLLAQALGILLMVFTLIKKVFNKSKIEWNLLLLNITLILCVLFWLFTAPFIRFALGYLLVLPLLAVSQYADDCRISVYKLFSLSCVIGILTCLMPCWSHYMMDTLVFVKHEITSPYYVIPKDYEVYDYVPVEINGNVFYKSTCQKLSYEAFPGIANMDFSMMGDDIIDGFKSN